MDFLKKHYEKITLAAALVLLIASAVFLALKVSALSTELNEAPSRAPRPQLTTHVPLQVYSNAMSAVTSPPIWTTNVELRTFDQKGAQPPKTIEVVTAATNGLPILLAVVHKPFTLLFKTYSYDTNVNAGYNFQLNFQFRARSFFIRSVGDAIKDRYEDTGYKAIKFEQKIISFNDPTMGVVRPKDVSELTVQHTGNPPKVLVLMQESVEEEPVAQVRCDVASPTREYRRGQSFQCGTKNYKVVDIDLKQMVIRDTQLGAQYTIISQQQ
jgi:hypothetical protein